mgnify:CR=1 FL=1
MSKRLAEPDGTADPPPAKVLLDMSQPVILRPVMPHDIPAIEKLHEHAFGPGRFARTAYRIREGLPPFSRHCRLTERKDGLVAAVRMAPITIGERGGALLLGPLAVRPELKGQGYGKALVVNALADSARAGCRLVVLVGDLPYYERFGFRVAPFGRLDPGGPVDPARLLVLEQETHALADYAGRIAADLAA